MQIDIIQRKSLQFIILLATSMAPGLQAAADPDVQHAAIYKILRPVYLAGVYASMQDKRSGKGPSTAYIHPERYANTRWVAFQAEVPAGTMMEILKPAPPTKDLFRRHDAYYVQLTPSPDQNLLLGLDIIVPVFGGFADSTGKLSKIFFERIN